MSDAFEDAGTSGRGPSAGDRLEALLREASEVQASDQQQMTTVLGEVREALNQRQAGAPGEIRAAVDEAVARLDAGIRGGQARTDEQIADLTRQVRETQDAVRQVGVDLDAAADEDGPSVQDLHDGMAGLRTDLRTLPEHIGPAVSGAVGTGLDSVSRSLDALETAQEETAHDVAELHAELSQLRPMIDALPATIAAMPRQGLDAVQIEGIVRDGVRDATRDFVRDYLREAVQDIVTVSTRNTERRITDHVDEAVLALAQALLHRRGAVVALTSGPDPDPAASEPLVPASPELPDPEVDPAPWSTGRRVGADTADSDLADEAADEAADEGSADAEAADEERPAHPVSAWQKGQPDPAPEAEAATAGPVPTPAAPNPAPTVSPYRPPRPESAEPKRRRWFGRK